jgi:putative ABC transport system permease protein
VRSVPGVAWAAPLRKGYAQVHLNGGRFQLAILTGLDDATLVGGPQPKQMRLGALEDLEGPDAIIIDEVGYDLLWPGEPLELGREVTVNEKRAVVVGVCHSSPTFQTLPIVYTRLSLAAQYLPAEANSISAILVCGDEGLSDQEVCRRIKRRSEVNGLPELLALTREQWEWETIEHYLTRTGILLNFLTTILLGFVVGVAVCGQTFYTFTLENMPQLGMLKAMGATNGRLVRMILLQAGVVGVIGYGLGVGLAAVFGEMTRDHSKLVFFMPWQVLVITGAAVVLVTMCASVLSIRRVMSLEPAIVVR